MNKLIIEGYTIDELNELIGSEEFETLIFSNRPVVINAGSAEILAQFYKEKNELHIDLAHIDGGGEGVLITISSLARKYASLKNIVAINWYVNATNCANPNPKLQHVLQLKNFNIKLFKEKGSVFYKKDYIN